MTARRALYNASGTITEIADGDTLVGASGGGGGTATEVEVDFGSTPLFDKTFTITDAAVSGSSVVMAAPSGKVATGRTGNDWAWDGLILSALPGTGNFALTALAVPGPVVGKRKIAYQVF